MNTESKKQQAPWPFPPEDSAQLKFCKMLNESGEQYKSRDGQMFTWCGTYWKIVPIGDLERVAIKFLSVTVPQKCSEKTAGSCAATAILNADPLDDPMPDLIPCSNGCVYLKTGELHPHKHDYCLTYCLDCEYQPDEGSPKFDAFLTEALLDDAVREFLQEFAGYTLLPDCRHQLACWLIGGGGNGKSTFAQTMQALHSNPVSMSLDGLDGFKLAGLAGASLVYCDETPARIDEQRLKTLISGDSVQIDRKYRDPITLRPTAKWIVSGNSLPAISDHSDGFWRRWIIVPFNTKPKAVQPLLAERIIDSELSGVLNWALEGLRRLLDRGAFPPLPEGLKTSQDDGKRQSNSVAGWMEDVEAKLAEGRDSGMAKSHIYLDYQDWCGLNGVRPVSSMKFWERIKIAHPGLLEWKRGEKRVRCVNLLFSSTNPAK